MCWEVLWGVKMMLAWDQGVTCWGRTQEGMYSLQPCWGHCKAQPFLGCLCRGCIDWGRDGSFGLCPFQIRCPISWAHPGVTNPLLLHEHGPYLKPNPSSQVLWKDKQAAVVLQFIKPACNTLVVFAKFSCLIVLSQIVLGIKLHWVISAFSVSSPELLAVFMAKHIKSNKNHQFLVCMRGDYPWQMRIPSLGQCCV